MKTRDLAYVALFAAIVAVLGLLPPIAIPVIPVNIGWRKGVTIPRPLAKLFDDVT